MGKKVTYDEQYPADPNPWCPDSLTPCDFDKPENAHDDAEAMGSIVAIVGLCAWWIISDERKQQRRENEEAA